MDQAHRRVGGIDALPARSTRARNADLNIGVIDLDFDLVGLGQDRNRGRASMNAPLAFRDGHPLHPMDARFILEAAISPFAFDRKDRLFDAAHAGFTDVEGFCFELVLFRPAQIHAIEFGGKETRFFAAGAGANFKNDIFVVLGIFGQQQLFHLLLKRGVFCFELGDLQRGQFTHLVVTFGEQSLIFRQLLFYGTVAPIGVDQLLDFAAFLR